MRSHRLPILVAAVVAMTAAALPTPEPPVVKITGEPGNGMAAYWVVAEDAEGRATDPSAPTIVRNLPDPLSEENFASIEIVPVAGATRYAVLKTHPLPPVAEVSVTAANPGDDAYYYWVEYWNNWRRSALSAPVAVQCGDPTGNVIEWAGMPNATWYNVYRTRSPEPPMGRGHYAVALFVAAHPRFTWVGRGGPTKVTDKGRLGQAVCGRPPTAIEAPPLGSGLFALGRGTGEAIVDQGQELSRYDVPNLNATERAPVTGPAAGSCNIVERLGAQWYLKSDNALPAMRVPSFGGGHAESLVVENFLHSGGHSEYHSPPNGVPGWKSWVTAITARTTSHTASQHGSLTTHLDVYGSGDAIPFGNTLNFYGTNNDNGDEGAYASRNSVIRGLNSWQGTLAEDAPRGGQWLPCEQLDWRYGGTERTVVNLTQAYTDGRIAKVDNIDVHGKGTNWTPDMVGHWISFDVDNVAPEGGKYGSKEAHRMWYWVVEVPGPTHLRILAKTGWSEACNLGYSRFIHDPAEQDGPTPSATNSACLRKLPKEAEAAAAAGGYLLCPGVKLADPWKEGKRLHVEPLQQPWKAGDTVRVVAGPQGYIALARYALNGTFLPQDQVGGISMRNNTNRVTNFPAIQIGGPGQPGFREGLHITVSGSGEGDGIVISNATTWGKDGFPDGAVDPYRSCIVVPNDVNGLSGHTPWRYPHLRWTIQDEKDAMQIAMTDDRVVASFDRYGTTAVQRLEVRDGFAGNGKTRGKTDLDGDGKTSRFTVRFGGRLKTAPVVTFNSNQFARSRLVEVDESGFTLEFETAPEAGDDNISIWWMAQE